MLVHNWVFNKWWSRITTLAGMELTVINTTKELLKQKNWFNILWFWLILVFEYVKFCCCLFYYLERQEESLLLLCCQAVVPSALIESPLHSGTCCWSGSAVSTVACLPSTSQRQSLCNTRVDCNECYILCYILCAMLYNCFSLTQP